jgi:hypothetical protein
MSERYRVHNRVRVKSTGKLCTVVSDNHKPIELKYSWPNAKEEISRESEGRV